MHSRFELILSYQFVIILKCKARLSIHTFTQGCDIHSHSKIPLTVACEFSHIIQTTINLHADHKTEASQLSSKFRQYCTNSEHCHDKT